MPSHIPYSLFAYMYDNILIFAPIKLGQNQKIYASFIQSMQWGSHPKLRQKLWFLFTCLFLFYLVYIESLVHLLQILVAMVLRDGHHHQYNSRSSSSSSSKKNKAKRIPRRGMGVAKLEKLRIEEQLHQNHSTSASITAPSTIDFFKSAGNDNSEQIKYLSSLGSNELRTMSSFRLVRTQEILWLFFWLYFLQIWIFMIRKMLTFFFLSFLQMYNKPALMPKPLLSGISIQIEPPSNQNFSMNSSTQHEEKVCSQLDFVAVFLPVITSTDYGYA